MTTKKPPFLMKIKNSNNYKKINVANGRCKNVYRKSGSDTVSPRTSKYRRVIRLK